MVSTFLRTAFLAGVATIASPASADDFQFNIDGLFGGRPCVSVGNGQAGTRLCADGNGGVRGGAVVRTPNGRISTPIRIQGTRNIFWDNTVFSCPANARHINNPRIDCDVNRSFNDVTLTPVAYGRHTYMCPVGTDLRGVGQDGLDRRCAIAATPR